MPGWPGVGTGAPGWVVGVGTPEPGTGVGVQPGPGLGVGMGVLPGEGGGGVGAGAGPGVEGVPGTGTGVGIGIGTGVGSGGGGAGGGWVPPWANAVAHANASRKITVIARAFIAFLISASSEKAVCRRYTGAKAVPKAARRRRNPAHNRLPGKDLAK